MGLNFLVISNNFSGGDITFDSALPVEDASASINTTVFVYARTVSLFGRSGNVSVAAPYDRILLACPPAEKVGIGGEVDRPSRRLERPAGRSEIDQLRRVVLPESAYTSIGADFTAFVAGYQYLWGAGL